MSAIGIDWDAIRAEISERPWERSEDIEGEERYVFLGTVFNLTPSGKYYTPFAPQSSEEAFASRFRDRYRCLELTCGCINSHTKVAVA